MDFFAAAARGDLATVERLLDLPDEKGRYPSPHDVDVWGHSACFYAQMLGQNAVVDVLCERGWTAMPPEDIFIGPGGRRMFWSKSNSTAGRVQPRVVSHEVPATAARPSSSSKMPAHNPSLKKAKVKARQQARVHYQPSKPCVGQGRGHPMFPRSAAGCKRSCGKPTLNSHEYEPHLLKLAGVLPASRMLVLRETDLESDWSEEWREEEEEREAAPREAPLEEALEESEALELALALSLSEASSASEGGQWVVLDLSRIPGGSLADLAPSDAPEAEAASVGDSLSVVSEGWEMVPCASAAPSPLLPRPERTWASLVSA